MSALPQAVKKVVDRANAIADQYYKDLAAANGTPPSEPAAPVIAEPAAPAAPEPPAAPAAPAPTPPEDTAEARYRSLQGKYNAEVPRLSKTVRDLEQKLSDVTSQLVATQNLLASFSQRQEPAVPATPPAATKLVSDDEIKEYGPDLTDVIRRLAQEEVSRMLPAAVQPVVERVAKTEKAVSTAAAENEQEAREEVLRLLEEKVPDYLTLNRDQGFLEWLDQVDPFSGSKRGALLQHAFRLNDGPRVVHFFLGYQKEHATVSPTPPAAAPEPAAPAPAPAAPQRTLESLVAPGTPKTGPVSTQDGSGKRIWTRKEIGVFYDAVTAGKYRGKDAQRKELEADIFAAQRENRVR